MTTRDAWAAAIRTELNSITSHTTTQTEHRATLAGGITVTLAPACFGATLTLSAPGRALTLTLTPEQVTEMPNESDWILASDRLWHDADWFIATTRKPNPTFFGDCGMTYTDAATLRALARAYQETQP